MSLEKKLYIAVADQARLLERYLTSGTRVETWHTENDKLLARNPRSPGEVEIAKTQKRLMEATLESREAISSGTDQVARMHSRSCVLVDTLRKLHRIYERELGKCGINSELLKTVLPGVVFAVAVQMDWLKHPVKRSNGPESAKRFLADWPGPTPREPKDRPKVYQLGSHTIRTKPVERLGHLAVPWGFARWFEKQLVREPEIAPSASTAPRKAGRKADTEYNSKVARILAARSNWRDDLPGTCAALDAAGIALPSRSKKAIGWKTWTDACRADPEAVRKFLQERAGSPRATHSSRN